MAIGLFSTCKCFGPFRTRDSQVGLPHTLATPRPSSSGNSTAGICGTVGTAGTVGFGTAGMAAAGAAAGTVASASRRAAWHVPLPRTSMSATTMAIAGRLEVEAIGGLVITAMAKA